MRDYLLILIMCVMLFMMYRIERQIDKLWLKILNVLTIFGANCIDNGESFTMTVTPNKEVQKKIG